MKNYKYLPHFGFYLLLLDAPANKQTKKKKEDNKQKKCNKRTVEQKIISEGSFLVNICAKPPDKIVKNRAKLEH